QTADGRNQRDAVSRRGGRDAHRVGVRACRPPPHQGFRQGAGPATHASGGRGDVRQALLATGGRRRLGLVPALRQGGQGETLMTPAEVLEVWRRYIVSPDGWRYIARRVRVGSQAALRERQRLDAWLEARASFNHS